VAQIKLLWQSKTVLLLVLPAVAAGVVLLGRFFAVNMAPVAIWTLGLSLLLGLVVHQFHAATPGGAFTGAVIAASLMFCTAMVPYRPWRTALVPLLAVVLLSHIATRFGRGKKERLGTAEMRQGRSASQVAANLGMAALVSQDLTQNWLTGTGWFATTGTVPMPLFALGLAALAEAAADTVSSEIGQVLGGRPRMITTLRDADPGTDGAISLAGTLAGVLAAGLVAGAGTLALQGGMVMFWVSWAGGVFGLFFDSLLGATLERRDWLNNDAVNFLSTASAAGFAALALVVVSHHGLR
jgi:uncharacterized protein (TIGR00297 family)